MSAERSTIYFIRLQSGGNLTANRTVGFFHLTNLQNNCSASYSDDEHRDCLSRAPFIILSFFLDAISSLLMIYGVHNSRSVSGNYPLIILLPSAIAAFGCFWFASDS